MKNRAAIEETFSVRVARCSVDELRVMDRVLEGIERGREQYGPLDVARDTREFSIEAADELRDCLFYLAAWHVAEQAKRSASFTRAFDELKRSGGD